MPAAPAYQPQKFHDGLAFHTISRAWRSCASFRRFGAPNPGVVGRPAGYIPELDHGPHDLHEFVRHGLIYPIEDESRDVRLNSDSMLRFYNEPGWLNVLRHFANFD